MLLPRCVDSPSDFLALTREEMAGSHFICFGFQKTFHSTDVFCTPSRLSVRLGFRLLCASLVVHYFTVLPVLRSLKLGSSRTFALIFLRIVTANANSHAK